MRRSRPVTRLTVLRASAPLPREQAAELRHSAAEATGDGTWLISQEARIMAGKPTTIDEYLAALSDDKRAALQKLRKTIKAAVPKAEECISYGLAAFRLNGRPLVAFGATGKHCAFYPMSSSTVAAHRDELKDYDTSKGTIRFQADKPLPAALVRKLVKARIAERG
jgi:uncharacterized protein YdhG (YjbR/CyaY superfamily)